MNQPDSEHDFLRGTEAHQHFQPTSFNGVDIYRQAKHQPDRFWREHLPEVQKGFHRAEFVDKSQPATVGIVIPAHNETLGKKDGNLQACLYAISQLKIPEGVTVKIMVIGHNNDPQDRAAQLLREISPKIEYLPYQTELRGFSYPLQAAGLVWQASEVREVGVIDADTVVNPNWLVAMHQALHSQETVGAVAGPRQYLDQQGNVMAYGRLKTVVEKATQSFFTKLVSGNSFYYAEVLRTAVTERLGTMMTDGDLQRQIKSNGQEVITAAAAQAISDGEKFVEKAALPLLIGKARAMLRPSVDDHLRFVMQELPSYFPDFRARLGHIMTEHNLTPDFITTASVEEKAEFLAFLEEQIELFNAESHEVMVKDIAQLVRQRPPLQEE